MTTRALVIEDDPETAGEIVAELSSHGFHVDWAANGSDGLARARSGNYDVMAVDRLLPEVDGLTIVENIRSHGIKMPVLILSALAEIDVDYSPVQLEDTFADEDRKSLAVSA